VRSSHPARHSAVASGGGGQQGGRGGGGLGTQCPSLPYQPPQPPVQCCPPPICSMAAAPFIRAEHIDLGTGLKGPAKAYPTGPAPPEGGAGKPTRTRQLCAVPPLRFHQKFLNCPSGGNSDLASPGEIDDNRPWGEGNPRASPPLPHFCCSRVARMNDRGVYDNLRCHLSSQPARGFGVVRSNSK